MKFNLSLILLFSLITHFSFGQETIVLKNPSFECVPQRGGYNLNPVKQWYDCGRINFKNQTAPDIHPADLWENTVLASEGNTYLGMVVRDNETWESVSQKLNTPLGAGKCYEISMEIAQSSRYISKSSLDQKDLLQSKKYQSSSFVQKDKLNKDLKEHNYTTPTVLRIWGATRVCGAQQLLAESSPVFDSDWKTYHFLFKPTDDYQFLVFEAFYKTPVLIPYNGHILLDNISTLIEIDCEKPISEITSFVRKETYAEEIVVNTSAPIKKVKKELQKDVGVKEDDVVHSYSKVTKKERVKSGSFDDIELVKLKKGHILSLEKVYFNADTSSIATISFKVLDELYTFLDKNINLKVEIGGHTNSTPPKSYCDKLSTARARVVANYLIEKGIEKDRVSYRGYGKHRPIARNNTKKGRKKNQRVEVKIIEVR